MVMMVGWKPSMSMKRRWMRKKVKNSDPVADDVEAFATNNVVTLAAIVVTFDAELIKLPFVLDCVNKLPSTTATKVEDVESSPLGTVQHQNYFKD